jgi:alpha-D-ribose 1-methylphosphonate 5-triphosphate diphosphatase
VIALRARRVLAEGSERHRWWVGLKGDRILHVGPEPPRAATRIDLGTLDLLPGFVDVHMDCLPEKAFPRPSSELPLESALLELDLEAAAHGITTAFIAVCLEDDLTKHRSFPRALETVAIFERTRPRLLGDHRLHLRVEVTGGGTPVAQEIARGGLVGVISYMDHTPGQGQFPDEATWREYYGRADGMAEAELSRLLAARLAGATIADDVKRELALVASEAGAVLVSHDDDSDESVSEALSLGVSMCEFPVNLVAAELAHGAGIGVVMGAPNARRGGSHMSNLSAREALGAGVLDALASDYHPPSLLAALYALAGSGACSWSEAAALVTSAPARLAGLADRGSIAPGMRADLVAVEPNPFPLVVSTWVAGSPVLQRARPVRAALREEEPLAAIG